MLVALGLPRASPRGAHKGVTMIRYNLRDVAVLVDRRRGAVYLDPAEALFEAAGVEYVAAGTCLHLRPYRCWQTAAASLTVGCLDASRAQNGHRPVTHGVVVWESAAWRTTLSTQTPARSSKQCFRVKGAAVISVAQKFRAMSLTPHSLRISSASPPTFRLSHAMLRMLRRGACVRVETCS